MKGKFIGQTYMGFVTGRTYEIGSKIQMIITNQFPLPEREMCICIYDKNSNAWCPYQNLESVMRNWVIKNK